MMDPADPRAAAGPLDAAGRAVRLGLALLLVGAVALAGGLYWLLAASRPLREGVLSVAGLEMPVEIRFDDRARPYVRAATLDDALFAEGFLHARERLWQMELLRRAGNGRLAEALGAAMLDTDRELWRMGVPQLAAKLEANAEVATRSRVERYVDGVNAALHSLPARPPELLLARVPLRPWKPHDVYAIGALVAFDSSRNAENELLRWALAQALSPAEFVAFLPDESALPSFPYIVAQSPALRILRRLDALDAVDRALLPSASWGSNGWVVAPSRSASGKALFAFDSHDALALPNLSYEVHLFFGEGRQVRGWSVPGLPCVVNGFNDRFAWGFTSIGDSQDLFLETRDPKDPLLFRSGQEVYRARTESVQIPVRGRKRPETLRIVHTRNGPLINDEPPVSLAWTAHLPGEFGIDALFELNLAKDWAGVGAALDRFAAPSANLTYADIDGHIGFRTVGLLPVRGRGEGLLPERGDEPEATWRGTVPMAELPRLFDPPRGFVAAANARVNRRGEGPLVSADNAPGYRMRRISTVLAAGSSHTPESMRALQMDWHNPQAERLLPELLAALDGEALDGAAAVAHALLRDWLREPLNAPEAAAPLIFERWYLELAAAVFAERLGAELWPRLLRRNYVLNQALDPLILGPSDSPWWRGDRDGLVRDAFLAAVVGLQGDCGAEPVGWRWDARHAVHLEHELGKAQPLLGRWLNRGPFPWGGGAATVGRAGYRYDRPGIVSHGATMRAVAEMTTPMQVWAVIPGGQSGHPLDAHYDDQIGAWLEGEHFAIPARFEEARGSTLRLQPTRLDAR
jgi:penicillin amidase